MQSIEVNGGGWPSRFFGAFVGGVVAFLVVAGSALVEEIQCMADGFAMMFGMPAQEFENFDDVVGGSSTIQ